MIPLQQLRIGNHFKWSDNTLIGTGTGIVNFYNIAFYRFMDGIPIKGNEQWLLDRGFYKEKGTEFYNFPHMDYQYCLKYREWDKKWALYQEYTDSPFPEDDGKKYPISFEYEFIHQIQNLIHILAHEELTLK